MKKFALVACCAKDEQAIKKERFLQSCVRKIREFLVSLNKEKLFGESVCKRSIGGEMEAVLITLPYAYFELSRLSRRKVNQVNAFLKGVCAENEVELCILPELIHRIQPFQGCRVNPFRGQFLYRCLLGNILDEIFSKRGIKTWELDINIIQGQSRTDLYSVIDLLSPMVRFLTVISEEKEIIEQEAGESFDDSGLAVMITADWKSALKNADLIINLDETQGLLTRVKSKNGAVLINLKDTNPAQVPFDGTLVNSVDVRIPSELREMLGRNLLRYFKGLEIAELLVLLELEMGKSVPPDEFPDATRMKQVTKAFKKGGFCITGFVGRHSIFRAEDIFSERCK